MRKPNVGIFGLTSCAGDQLAILNCEDELLEIMGAVEIKTFHMATSENDDHGGLDIALVEGAVVQPEEVEYLKKIRSRAKLLMAIGTCAVWGGVPSMLTLPPQSLKNFVKVDFSIPGCPIEKEQLLKSLGSLLHEDLPQLPGYAVCTECKINEYPCLLVEKNAFCCGPITVAGCGARCPKHGLTCIGCRGPVDEANLASEIEILKEKGFSLEDIKKRLHTFAPPIEKGEE